MVFLSNFCLRQFPAMLNMCFEEKHTRELIASGAVSQLAIGLISPCDRLQVAAAATLQCVAFLREGKSAVHKVPEVIPRLVSLLGSSNPVLVERALGVLNNVSSHVGAASQIIAAGATKSLVEILLKCSAGPVTEFAAGTLQNIARLDAGRAAAVAECATEPLAVLVTCPHMPTRIASIAALLNVRLALPFSVSHSLQDH